MAQDKIINYLSTGPVSSCPCAYLVSGKQAHEELNRNFLEENKTGHWILAEGRIFRGDAMFMLLPSPVSQGYFVESRKGDNCYISPIIAIGSIRRRQNCRWLFRVNKK